jgi:hypothetical protein
VEGKNVDSIYQVFPVWKGARFGSMARKSRKITSTRKQQGTAKPAVAKKVPATTKNEKDDEGWGPIGTVAKKVAKGAVKGAAKELSK